MLKFLKNSYNYGFKQNQKPLGQPKSGSKPKSTEKKDYTLIYWKPKAEGKYQIRFVPSKTQQRQPISGNFYALWSWKIPNSSINKLGRG